MRDVLAIRASVFAVLERWLRGTGDGMPVLEAYAKGPRLTGVFCVRFCPEVGTAALRAR